MPPRFCAIAAEIERAEALVDAFDGGAERFGNEMIERMHVEAAQRLLGRRTPEPRLGESRLACHGPIWPNSTTPLTSPSD